MVSMFHGEQWCDLYLGVFNSNEELIDKKFYKRVECMFSSLSSSEQVRYDRLGESVETKVLVDFDKNVSKKFLVVKGEEEFNVVDMKNNGFLDEYLTLYLKRGD